VTDRLSKSDTKKLLIVHSFMGFIQFGLGFSVALLKQDFGITRVLASSHNLCWALSVILISIWAPKYICKIPPQKTLRLGWTLMMVGIYGFCFGDSIWVTVPFFGLAAVGATLFNNTNSGVLGSTPSSALKMMFRSSGLGTFCGAFLPTSMGVLIREGIEWRISILVATSIFGVVSLLIIPKIAVADIQGEPNKVIHWSNSFILLVFLGFLTTWLEVGAVVWSVELLFDRGANRSSAVIFASGIWYVIGLWRVLISSLSKIPTNLVWRFSSACIVIGVLIISISHDYKFAFIGLFITALGVGSKTPISLTCSVTSNQSVDHGVATFTIGMGAALGLAPWAMAWISESYGFSHAYFSLIIILLITNIIYSKVTKTLSIY